MSKVEIKCKSCKKVFSSYRCGREDQLNNYCSKSCYGKSLKKGSYGKCLQCNKILWIVPSKLKRGAGKFCSRACRNKAYPPKGRLKPITIKYCLSCKIKMELPSREKNKKYCSRKCLSDALRGKPNIHCIGENHPNWQGGITPLKLKIRKSLEMRSWREKVFSRDNFACTDCGSGGGRKNPLNAHHVIMLKDLLIKFKITSYEEAMRCVDLWDIKNGITVCKKCHEKIHQKEIKNEQLNTIFH